MCGANEEAAPQAPGAQGACAVVQRRRRSPQRRQVLGCQHLTLRRSDECECGLAPRPGRGERCHRAPYPVGIHTHTRRTGSAS